MKPIFSLAIFVVSVCAFFIALDYQFWVGGRPGAGFFPLLITGGLILLAGINTIIDIKNNRDRTETVEYFELKDMLVISFLIIAYMSLFSLLGYKVSTLLFILATLFYLKPKSVIQNIVVSIILVAIIYVVFDFTLSTGLPTGIF